MHFLSFLYSVATAFVGFFTHVVWGVIVDWWALPVGERVGKFLGFTGALAALLEGSRWIGQRIFKSRTRLEQHIEWLELEVKAHLAKIDEKQLQLEAISRENAELLTWYPLTARKAAERERRDGNDESEARILTEYLVKITPDIAAITRALTQFHIAFSIENPQLHLAEARRYGDISGQLDLGNEESHDLMATVTRLHSEFQVERLIAESERPVADQIAHELGIDLIYSPETRIDYLREVGFALSAKGLIRAAYLFVDRAARYAAGKLPPTHGLRATTECWAGVLQANVGEIRSGWNRFEKAWPVVKDKLGARSKAALQLRLERAKLLQNLGEYDRTLREIDAVHTDVEQIFGHRNPFTLSTRYWRALVLQDLGRHAEALDEIEALLPVRREVSGERHPDTLASRHLRASVLGNLGRNAEALDEIEALLPVLREVSGERHPDILTTCCLRASVLGNLGRHAEALDEIEALLPVLREVSGKRHPNTLATRHLRASVLGNLGRNAEALDEIEALLPVQREVSGERHPYTLVAESLRFGILVASGHARQALEPLRKCIDDLVSQVGDGHRYTQHARYRLARALLAVRHTRKAREECDAVLAVLPTIMERCHPLFASVLVLSDLIDGRENDGRLIV